LRTDRTQRAVGGGPACALRGAAAGPAGGAVVHGAAVHEAVDDLVDGAVPAVGHDETDVTELATRGRPRDGHRVAAMLGLDHLELDLARQGVRENATPAL